MTILSLRQSVRRLVEAPRFTNIIIALIVFNAAILGLETYPTIMASHGDLLRILDHILLWIFVMELGLRLFALGGQFFKDPWCVFDFIVISLALVPAQESLSVLRAVRVLRVLRLISAFPRLRNVVQGLISAIPGIGAIGAILLIVFYVFAVMATKLFGASFPDWFGSLQNSLFSLFQIMTLEGWPDIVREVKATYPFAWIFFICYILVATFTVLNLFIAVVVEAMQRQHEAEEKAVLKQEDQEEENERAYLRREMAALHAKIDALAKK
jgi:voltage-gated sodium channel